MKTYWVLKVWSPMHKPLHHQGKKPPETHRLRGCTVTTANLDIVEKKEVNVYHPALTCSV
jgi:hypothetical protein